jgi:hypothetical protein
MASASSYPRGDLNISPPAGNGYTSPIYGGALDSYTTHAAHSQTTLTPEVIIARTPVSNLARRIHGWSWQAVRVFCGRRSGHS